MSKVVELQFEIKEAGKDCIIIVEKNLKLAITIKRLKRGLKLIFSDGLKERKTYLRERDLEDQQILEDHVCTALKDFEDLSAVCKDVATDLLKVINEWEDLEVIQRMREFLKEEKPALVVKEDDQILDIYGEDGLAVSIAGGLISLDHRRKAVVETTYVYGRLRRVRSHEGDLTYVEGVHPVMAIAEWVREFKEGELGYRWVLKKRKFAIASPKKAIEIHGRPVRIIAKSVSGDSLTTMASVEVLKRFEEGAASKPLSEIYRDLRRKVEEYISFYWDKRLYDVFTCHIMGTYFHDFFNAFPELYLFGPYGSGKTRTGLVWAYASYHGFPVLQPSEASIFRSIEALKPSIYIDESALTPSLMKLLGAGYKKGVHVPRVERTRRDQFILALFNIYSPKCYGYTELPSEELLQRCIVIIMKIAKLSEIKKDIDPNPEDFEDIRNELYLARLTRANEVFEAMEEVSKELRREEITGRELELWLPILTIAKLVGREVYGNVKSYMKEDILRRKQELYSEEKTVLRAIEKLFIQQGKEEIAFQVKDLQDTIKEILYEEGSYNERTFNKQWEVRRLGLILKRMNIRRCKVGKNKEARYVRIITISEFKELCEKYGYEPTELKSVESVKSVKFLERGTPDTHNELKSETHVEDHEISVIQFSENITDSTDFTDLARGRERKLNLIEAIKEILKEGPKSDIEVYEELVRYQRLGRLEEGIVVNWEKVINVLKYLEEKGVVARTYSEIAGEEKYYLLGD